MKKPDKLEAAFFGGPYGRITMAENTKIYLSDTTCTDNYRQGWKMIFATFGILLGITLIFLIIQAPTNWTGRYYQHGGEFGREVARGMGAGAGAGLFSTLYWVFLAGPISMSFNWAFLKAARGEEVRVGDMFAVFTRNYWNAVGAGVLTGLIIIAGLIFLIVPGIIFAIRLVFVPYLVIDRRMGVTEAITTSWRMTKGRGGTIFLMGLLAIPIFIGGAIALGVGIIISFMWTAAAFAVLYHSVTRGEQPA
jgi:uncharacterized membrane protein